LFDNFPSSLHRPDLTPPTVLPNVYWVLFPEIRIRKLTSHFHVVPKLKIRRGTLHSPYVFTTCYLIRHNSNFTFT